MPNFYRMWSSQFQRWLVSLEKQDIYVSKKVKKQKAPILITLPLFLQAFWTQGIQFCSWVLTLFSTNKTPLNWIIFDTFFIHIWMIMYLIMDDFKSYTSPKKFLISKTYKALYIQIKKLENWEIRKKNEKKKTKEKTKI